MSESYTSLYLLALAVVCILEIALEVLNIRSARSGLTRYPPMVQELLTPAAIARAGDYTQAKGRMNIASSVVSAAILMVLVVTGGLGMLDALVESQELSPRQRGVLVVVITSLCFTLLQLPLGYISTFHVEERFGFNRTSPRLWILDRLKGMVLSAVISIPLLYGVLWFMEYSPDRWWLWSAFLILAVQLAVAYLFPTCIAPFFNRFTELDSGELRERVLQLAHGAGMSPRQILVMDGSRRSRHANAYFAGMGKRRRIVLFDTLIQTLQVDEIEAVLAHEIGHLKRWHLWRSLALSAVFLLTILWAAHRLLQQPEVFTLFGFERMSPHAGVLILLFFISPFMFLLSPLFSSFSRMHEYEADRYAVKLVNRWEPLAQALTRLSKESLSNVSPHWLYSFFHYSHPTLVERVRAMENIPAGRPASRP